MNGTVTWLVDRLTSGEHVLSHFVESTVDISLYRLGVSLSQMTVIFVVVVRRLIK